MGETPGTIPNPEVKPHFADGTALATEWESRALPAFFLSKNHLLIKNNPRQKI